jgi:hypothetical protein
MTAPVPPGRVQAPPLTAAEARQETVARAIAESCVKHGRCSWEYLAAAAIAADDAWRAGQEGGLRERVEAAVDALDRSFPEDVYATHRFVRSIRAALSPADHEPAAAIQRVLISVEAAELSIAHGLPVDWSEFLAAIRAAVSGVQPAATEPGQ